VRTEEHFDLRVIGREKAREKLISDLKLIYGIGWITERALKEKGYSTLEDLTGHPRFGERAETLLKIVDAGHTERLCEWIGRWFPAPIP